jgi:hypothetical protein
VKIRLWIAAVATLAIAGLGWLGWPTGNSGVPGARPVEQRPKLALLTSLPLLFGERFSLEDNGSPALARLDQRYSVVPIGVADAASLKGRRLLLMAQPRAQPAEALVDLDRWVRGGGHVLLLADPRLDWPSERPLGDPLRPPPMFADTGLLKHWGLELSPAGLVSGHECSVGNNGLVAHCRVGQGRATVIADADFLNVDRPDAPGLDPLIIELDRLETR